MRMASYFYDNFWIYVVDELGLHLSYDYGSCCGCLIVNVKNRKMDALTTTKSNVRSKLNWKLQLL